ncbi:MAG: DUF2231 domain-containing protein [Aquihabitans sp.]
MRTEERHRMQEDTAGLIDPAGNGNPSDNESLSAVLRELGSIGFASSYRPSPEPVEGRPAVVCGTCGRATAAEDLRVDVERRLEGASEPDEMVLAVAATCPACGTGGVIVLGYGPEASAEDSDLVLALHRPTVPAEASGDTVAAGSGGGDDEGDGEVADPGGDSDPDANEGFEPPADRAEAPHTATEETEEPSGPTGLGRFGAAIDEVEAIDAVADPIHRAIDGHLPARLRSLLQGRWLGHPAHPLLTDVVIGFWTSAWVLDLLGDERTEGVADAFVAAGVVTAVPTVWAGWADWIELPRGRRRSGIVHAASNATATALYGASWFARRRGNRTLGVGLGHAGAAVATVGGYLGGHLAFGD